MTTDKINLADLRQAAERYADAPITFRVTATPPTVLALIDAIEAAHGSYVRTGACPACEHGPPPFHSDRCALARFDHTPTA